MVVFILNENKMGKKKVDNELATLIGNLCEKTKMCHEIKVIIAVFTYLQIKSITSFPNSIQTIAEGFEELVKSEICGNCSRFLKRTLFGTRTVTV